MSKIVGPYGTVTFTVPAAGKIAVQSDGDCNLYQDNTFVNYPPSRAFIGVASGGAQTTFGAYSAGGTFTLEAGPYIAYYEVGSNPNVDARLGVRPQGTPIAKTTAVTLTIAELMQRLITGTHTVGATAAYTLPTGTLCEAGETWESNDAFDWTLINKSAAAVDTITITAGVDHTLVGEGIVQSAHASTGLLYGSSATFRTRRVSAAVFETYRLT